MEKVGLKVVWGSALTALMLAAAAGCGSDDSSASGGTGGQASGGSSGSASGGTSGSASGGSAGVGGLGQGGSSGVDGGGTGGSGAGGPVDECANPSASWLLCDGFESYPVGGMQPNAQSSTGYSLGPWSTVTPKNSIVGSPVFGGSRALHIPYDKATTGDSNRFVQANLASHGLDHFFIRARFMFVSKAKEADQKKLLYLWSSNTGNLNCGPWCIVLAAWKELTEVGSEPMLLKLGSTWYDAALGKSEYRQWSTGKVLTYDVFHDIETEVKLNQKLVCTQAVDCDGEVRIWLNGTLVLEKTKVQLRIDDGVLGNTRVGAQANDNGTPFDEDRYIDNVIVSSTHIGPAP